MRVIFGLFLILVLALNGPAAAAEPAKQPGMLGAEVADVTKEDADKLKWDEPTGVKIVKPNPGSPAEAAGLKPGDIILSLDGQELNGMTAFITAVGAKGAGAQVKLKFLRDGALRILTATLAARPVEQAAAPPESPLRPILDTGGHTSVINGVTQTPDGKFIISASDDKAIRIWDWRTGKTVRTIRGEVSNGDGGKVFAMALSPDGTTLAAAGWMKTPGVPGHHIRLYNMATGVLTTVLKGHTDVIVSLAFSPDGTRLISGSADKSAIVWDIKRQTALKRLEGHTAEIYGVGFTPDGARAVTGSYDTTLRLWSVTDGKLITEMKGHPDKVRALAVNSHNGTIASGDRSGEVRIWDGTTGKQLHLLKCPNVGVGSMAFSRDGSSLLASNGTMAGKDTVTIWATANWQEVTSYMKHGNIVLAAEITRDGRYAISSDSEGEIHIWELATGKPVPGSDGKPLVLKGTGRFGWAAGFSADGSRIAWGTTYKRAQGGTGASSELGSPLEFQLRLPRVDGETIGQPEPVAASDTNWRRAVMSAGDMKLAHRKGGTYDFDALLDITRDNNVIATIERGSTDGFAHRSYTLTPDGKSLISGGNGGSLFAYDLTGKKLGEFVGHQSEIWAVTTSADGRFLITGSADQSVRLWNLKSRELLITLFRGTDGQWVAWTPQGYYTGSPGADALIGWQLNKGADKTPDYFAAEQLRRQFNRPDIVSKAIILASATEAVRTSEGTTFTLEDLIKRPPPRVTILSPTPDAALTGGDTIVTIHIDPTVDPVRKLTLRVNGRTVHEQAVGSASGDIALKVPLGTGANAITVIAGNEVGDTTAEVHVSHAGEGRLNTRGVLYVVAVGVDKYPNLSICGPDKNASCNLRFSGADAETFAATMKKALGDQHTKTDVQLLTASSGTQPTANNIRDALQRVRNLATETDTVMVFTAGHGVNDGADYLFLTADAAKEGRGWRGSTVLKWTELESVIFGARGARFLFVDTCHSSGAYNAKLGNEAFHNDVTAFTATGPEELALEFGELKHGVFTYTIAEGLGARAKEAANGGREVRTSELAAFLATRSSALIDLYKPGYEVNEKRRKPIPHLYRARDAADHVLARVD